jgi:hypothetical protein
MGKRKKNQMLNSEEENVEHNNDHEIIKPKKKKRKIPEDEEVEDANEEEITEVSTKKDKKKKRKDNDENGVAESYELLEEAENSNGEMEEQEEPATKRSKKKKKRQEADDEEEIVEEVVSKKDKKKKKKHNEDTEEAIEESPVTNGYADNEKESDNNVEDNAETLSKTARKKLKKQKRKDRRENEAEEDGELSDIEKRYVTAVRVKVDDAGDVHRLKGRITNLETKVYDLSEDEWNPDDPLKMPPQGILVDGLPFHHCYPYPLKKHHIRRLFAHGIILKTTQFTPGEDEQIIENWKKFAEKNTLDYEDAPLYCGWAKHLGHELPLSIKKLHRKTKFFPYICAGLLQRCAIQVYRRCYRIFDPRYDAYGRTNKREWTEEEDRRLQALYNFEGPSWQKIAVQLRRNRFQVQDRYQRIISGEKPIPTLNQGKTKLMYIKDDEESYGLIYEHAKDMLPVHPIVLVTKGIGEEEDKNINWNRLCRKYSNLTVEKCQTQWTKIKAQLRATYNRENNPSITFSAIEKSVFGTNPKRFHNLKPKIAQKAFKIMRDLAEENEIDEIWEIDIPELTRRLKEADVLFYTTYTLGSHLLKTAHKILKVLRNADLLRILPPETTVVDLIDMLAYFMKKSRRKLSLSKTECLHYMQCYIRHKKWTPNVKYEIIDKKQLAQLEALRAEDNDDDDKDDQQDFDAKENVDDDEEDDELNDETSVTNQEEVGDVDNDNGINGELDGENNVPHEEKENDSSDDSSD